jgi:AcrR family transcriptional regulator
VAAQDVTKRGPLDQATIVTAAIELADEVGVDALTMRALAERLGFKVMALYNHVASKDELLGLMVEAVAAEIPLVASGSEALQAVRAHVVATRACFVRHPWAVSQWQRYLPGPARTDQMESLLKTLNHSGLSPETAHLGYHAVNNHVLGYSLQEMAMSFPGSQSSLEEAANAFMASISIETHPHTIAHVHEHLDGKTSSSFETVLDIILDGLRRRDDGAEV